MKKILIALLLMVCCFSVFLLKLPKVKAYNQNLTKNINYTQTGYLESNEFIIVSDNVSNYWDIQFTYSVTTINYFNEDEYFTIDFTDFDYTILYSDGTKQIEDNGTISLNLTYTTIYDFDTLMLETNTFTDFVTNYTLNLFTYISFIGGEDYILVSISLNNDDDSFYFEITQDLVVPLINFGNTSDFVLVNTDGYYENTQYKVPNVFTDFAYQIYVENTTQHPQPLEPNVDMWTWLGDTIGGFMDFEIFPSFSIGAIFNIVISIALFLIFLKVFVGG